MPSPELTLTPAPVLSGSVLADSAVEVVGTERDIVVACLASDEPAPYNVPVFLRFDEPVEPAALAAAVDAVLADTPLLRRVYRRSGRRLTAHDGGPPARTERLRVGHPDELSAVAAARRIGVLDQHLIRTAVIEVTTPGAPIWLFVGGHHAQLDGLSLTLLLRRILDTLLTDTLLTDTLLDGTLLDGTRPPASPPLPAPLPALQPLRATPPPRHQVVADPGMPGQGPEIDRPVEPSVVGAFRTSLTRRQRPGAGIGRVRRTLTGTAAAGFPTVLAAAVPALGAWADTDAVVVATALAGRTPATATALGNHVRLAPLAFDLGRWAELDPAEVALGLTRLAAGLAVRSQQPAGPDSPLERVAQVGVVVDYKRESLVPRRLHPALAAELVEDLGYLDAKYDVHLSIYQTGDQQQVTLTGRDLPERALLDLLDGYAAHLRLCLARNPRRRPPVPSPTQTRPEECPRAQL